MAELAQIYFDDDLRLMRCFVCGGSTHASHLKQRQCTQCRRKWSFERISRRWELAHDYACYVHPTHAAQHLAVSRKTTGHWYHRFSLAIRKAGYRPFQSPYPQDRPDHPMDPPYSEALKILFEAFFKPKMHGLGTVKRPEPERPSFGRGDDW